MPLAPFREALIGKQISHVWRGFGSALFLEFGELSDKGFRRDGSKRNPAGEISLMIEWSWRIEKPRSILGGSWSPDGKWPVMFKKLLGSTVIDISISTGLPELILTLSSGLKLKSFMTAEGQPAWAIITRSPNLGTLQVKSGRLFVEATPNIPFKRDQLKLAP